MRCHKSTFLAGYSFVCITEFIFLTTSINRDAKNTQDALFWCNAGTQQWRPWHFLYFCYPNRREWPCFHFSFVGSPERIWPPKLELFCVFSSWKSRNCSVLCNLTENIEFEIIIALRNIIFVYEMKTFICERFFYIKKSRFLA